MVVRTHFLPPFAAFLLALMATNAAEAGDRAISFAYVDVSTDADADATRVVREQILGAVLQCGTTPFAICERERRPSDAWGDVELHDAPSALTAEMVRGALRGDARQRRAMESAFTSENEWVDGLIVVDVRSTRVRVSVVTPDGQRLTRRHVAHTRGAMERGAIALLTRSITRPVEARFVP